MTIPEKILEALMPLVAIAVLTLAAFSFPTIGTAEDAPPASSAPPSDDEHRRHHDPEWNACRKKADDQKLTPGDARKELMKNCMKSAKNATAGS